MLCGYPGSGEAWVERCEAVPDAKAALARFEPHATPHIRDWTVVGIQVLVYDFEDSWAHSGQSGLEDERDFWHLTWRTGPAY